MKTHFVLKSSLIALVASSALMAGQLYAADPVADTGVKTTQENCKTKGHHGHDKGGMHKMLRKLDLTDAQKADVKLIVEKYKAQAGERPTKEMRAAHKAEMLSLVTSANFDESAAQAMIEQKQQQHQQKSLQMLKMQNEIYQLLTPEQQEKFAKRFENGHKKRK